MSSAFERLQKIAQQKKESEKEKTNLELVNPSSAKSTDKSEISFFDIPNQPNVGNIPNQPNQPNQPVVNKKTAQLGKSSNLKTRNTVSPERDFTKVPNSVARDIVPERFFKGMSKNTYDALYLRTRGAITPVRKIRATKSDLLRWTGVSDVTLDKHLKHLRSVGLINWEFIIGSHDGNLYEIFVPEELDLSSQTYLTNLTNPNLPNVPKKVGGQVPNFLGYVGGVQSYENKELSQSLKTSLKTKRDDDEKNAPFSAFIEKFEKVSKKLTGKKFDPKETDKWEMLADLLILELEIAAKRSGSISSVPAFLTEVLRRQLFTIRRTKSDQDNYPKKNSKLKSDTVGKSDAGKYEIKPLDKKGREEALAHLREFVNDGFLQDFKKWYTSEDWEYLIKELQKQE